jgi:hypothetical protein
MAFATIANLSPTTTVPEQLLRRRVMQGEELERLARERFERSAKAQGFVNHTPWDELHEETRENWREFVRKQSTLNTGSNT